MNYFLVGNGFDLNHKFPTRYIDFLHVVQFLVNHKDEKFNTVGEVLGNNELTKINPFILECYEKHKNIYNATVVDNEKIKRIVTKAENNIWFKYLYNCTSRNINWIDFEKEIIRVINAFEDFLYGDGLDDFEKCLTFDRKIYPDTSEVRYILSQFNFFYKSLNKSWVGCSEAACINDEYITEMVYGSQNLHIKIEDIVSKLYEFMRELADILKEYLLCFVDSPAKEYSKLGIKPKFTGLPTPNHVYSFNYTNTVEHLYENYMVNHIHGNTNSNIVLGINPDQNDKIESIDTTFLQFKKYFQRTFYNTDLDFLENIKHREIAMSAFNSDIRLYVIGHSLDSTDADVIKQIFSISNEIWILYHDDVSVKNQIKNLVNIYGKEGLDALRVENKLTFVPQSNVEWIYPE